MGILFRPVCPDFVRWSISLATQCNIGGSSSFALPFYMATSRYASLVLVLLVYLRFSSSITLPLFGVRPLS